LSSDGTEARADTTRLKCLAGLAAFDEMVVGLGRFLILYAFSGLAHHLVMKGGR